MPRKIDSGCIVSSRNHGQWDSSRLPAIASVLPAVVQQSSDPECFCPWNVKGLNPLNTCVAETLDSLTKGKNGKTAVVKIGENQFAAEHKSEKGTTIVVASTNGMCRAAVINDAGRYHTMPALPSDDADLTPLYACYIALCANTDFIEDRTVSLDFKAHMSAFLNGDSSLREDIFYINDVLVSGFERSLLKISVDHGNIGMLTEQQLKNSYRNGEVLCGSPEYLASSNSSGNSKRTAGDLYKKYESVRSENMKRWTEEEKKRIPSIPMDVPVQPEIDSILNSIISSRGMTRPMKNFLWRGITAYGKSFGVEVIASVLGVPLLKVTCSSTMDSILTEYVPVDSGSFSAAELPDFTSIMMDPCGAYKQLTGLEAEDVDCQEVLEAYGKAAAERAGNGAARFRLVESNYVKALRNGYICEIQEMSRIKDPGFMVSLNEYDHAGALIPLADGTFVPRHEDAVVIFTDNVGYASCRTVDPSVMRRMDRVYNSFELTDDMVRERIKYNTGFADDDLLSGMTGVWKDVIRFCKDNDITDGEISVSELERWVQVVQIEGMNGLEAGCRECVISKATSDREDLETVWASVQPAVEQLMAAE